MRKKIKDKSLLIDKVFPLRWEKCALCGMSFKFERGWYMALGSVLFREFRWKHVCKTCAPTYADAEKVWEANKKDLITSLGFLVGRHEKGIIMRKKIKDKSLLIDKVFPLRWEKCSLCGVSFRFERGWHAIMRRPPGWGILNYHYVCKVCAPGYESIERIVKDSKASSAPPRQQKGTTDETVDLNDSIIFNDKVLKCNLE